METTGHASSADAEGSIQILNPATDFAFRIVFKDLVVIMDFLNCLLNLPVGERICSIKVLERELPSDHFVSHSFAVEVDCGTQKIKHYLIQLHNKTFRDNDSLHSCFYELSRMYFGWLTMLQAGGSETVSTTNDNELANKRAKWSSTNATSAYKQGIVVPNTVHGFYVITFRHSPPMNESSPQEPDIINRYEMLHSTSSQQRRLPGIPVCVYELALYNFSKTDPSELSNNLERWLFAVKDDNLVRMVGETPTSFDMYKRITNLNARCGTNMALRLFYSILNVNNISPIAKVGFESLEASFGGIKK